MPKMPVCTIIAGPNGAGKTTFAEEYLPNEGGTIHFVNADLIAKGISPFAPEKSALFAGKVLLDRLDDLAAAREDFAFETTLSGMSYLRRINHWKSNGYEIRLIFLRLADVEMAQARVSQRVSEGGHDVPSETLKRRFLRGLRNLELYKSIVSEWIIYDNSGDSLEEVENGRND
jgi:predicted ABC-type ATPase